MKNLFACLLFGVLEYTAARADDHVGYLGIEQGLSNNAVTRIFQDKQGFMWFGTYNGLNRYDGYEFKIFRNQPETPGSLCDNRITAITQDSRSDIWVGTKWGVSVLSIHSGQFSDLKYRIGDKPPGEVETEINGFAQNRYGDLFIATARKGLLEYKNEAKELVAIQIPLADGRNIQTDYHVHALEMDAKGQLWLMIPSVGLCYYDDRTNRICTKNKQLRTATCMESDLQGNIWIGTDDGLWKYQVDRNTYVHYPKRNGGLTSNLVADLQLMKDGTLWISTDGGGINILHPQKDQICYISGEKGKGSLTSSSIFAVYEDNDFRKWIGTLRGGINIIDPLKVQFRTVAYSPDKNSVAGNFILSFCEDEKSNVWIGTDGEGLSYWDRKSNVFTNYRNQPGTNGSLSNNFVTSIVKDNKNALWIATYGGGINRINSGKHTFVHYACLNAGGYEDRYVWKLFEDSKGDIWAGTVSDGGLYMLNKQTDKFESYDSGLKNVLSIAEDSDNQLWLGSYNELIRLDLASKANKRYAIGNGVRAIQVLPDYLWLGTEGGGLLKFNKTKGSFSRLTEKDGLPSNAILNILEDNKQNLWLSTYSGLAKFHPADGSIKNYFVSDGLQSDQFNYNAAVKLHNGEFLLGGIMGFNAFFPDSIKSFNHNSKIMFTSLLINNTPFEQYAGKKPEQDIYHIDKLILPYDEAVLSFEFAALEFSSPDKIRYAYYLEGWDKDWNYTGKHRKANYTRLKEGDYVLRIKATNADGVWIAQEKKLYLKVLPPWWRTVWAYAAYLMFTAGAIYLYLRYSKRQAQLKYEVNLATIKMEQEKELNEKKLSFFTYISHEFRTPLTLIANPVKEWLYSENKVIDNEQLSAVYRNSKRLLSLVDQLMLFRKADSEADKLKLVRLNVVELCYEVFLCFKQHADYRRLTYHFCCDEDQVHIYGDREKLEITLFNLISNAIKFTPAGGTVQMALKHDDNRVEICIIDSGCGIPKHVGEDLFRKFYRDFEGNRKGIEGFGIGLFLVKKFVEGHKGSITYISEPNKGTTFTLDLLKGRAHFEGQYVFEDVSERSIFLDELLPEKEDAVSVVDGQAYKKEVRNLTEVVSEQPVLLIVDDNAEIREYVRQLFEENYRVYQASDGETGLAMASSYQPDILLSDVVMKGMTGIDLCIRIKQDPALSHIPVILLTGSASDEVKLKGIEGGADDYITKPFDKAQLMARVAGILKSRDQMKQYFFNEITLQANNFSISSEYSDFLNKCIQIVEKHLNDPDFNVKVLAAEVGMSHSNLYRKVKSISGNSVNEFIRFIRLRKVASLLITEDYNINEAAFEGGFSDIKYFREQFFKLFGLKPSEYKKKYKQSFQKSYNMNNQIGKK